MKLLLYFLLAAFKGPSPREELDEQRRRRADPRGWGAWLTGMAILTLAVGALYTGLTGQRVGLDVRGLGQVAVIAGLALGLAGVIGALRQFFGSRSADEMPEGVGGEGGCALVMLAILALVGLIVLVSRLKNDATQDRERAATAAREMQASDALERDDPGVSANSRRPALELRWRKARSIAVEKWRADVLAANVLGEIGVRPPMLSVTELGAQVLVKNVGKAPVCVSLARITRPDTDAVRRCQVGPATCSPIKPGMSFRFKAENEGADGCTHAALEYRVGSVDFPEPTWWSRTAFNAFQDPPADISYKDEADLHADIARFEATVEDADRAARWRRERAIPRP